MAKEDGPDRKGGRRKDGQPFKDGNIRDDGSYGVGRGRPPQQGKFAVGDGRKRGRRAKGVKNFTMYFLEEAERVVPLKVDGKGMRAPQMQVAIKTMFHKAIAKQEISALAQVLDYGSRIYDTVERKGSITRESDHDLIEEWFAGLAATGQLNGAVTDDAGHRPSSGEPEDVSGS